MHASFTTRLQKGEKPPGEYCLYSSKISLQRATQVACAYNCTLQTHTRPPINLYTLGFLELNPIIMMAWLFPALSLWFHN